MSRLLFLLFAVLLVDSRLLKENKNHEQILPIPKTLHIPNTNETITILIPGFVDNKNS